MVEQTRKNKSISGTHLLRTQTEKGIIGAFYAEKNYKRGQ